MQHAVALRAQPPVLVDAGSQINCEPSAKIRLAQDVDDGCCQDKRSHTSKRDERGNPADHFTAMIEHGSVLHEGEASFPDARLT